MAVRIRDRDRGYKKLTTRVRNSEPTVEVGVFAAEGARGYPDSEATVLDVAVWNEFGTRTVPARSFLRGWYEARAKELMGWWKELTKKVISGKISTDKAANMFGQKCVGEIQERIAQGIPPPNAASTVKRKGSSVPLIDTGQLRSSITYKTEE